MRARRLTQATFAFSRWGGRRRGAGRKPNGRRAGVPHGPRPRLAARHPVHATLRLCEGLPSLRKPAERELLHAAFCDARLRGSFRLVHFSAQSNHLHLLVEAGDRAALGRGMQGLAIRLARRLNRLWGRRGSVFADRYHARALPTPREVRHALVYVLANARRHGIGYRGIDPHASGAWFGGWRDATASASAPAPVSTARTWLLAVGWRRHGLIGTGERPRAG